jgi:hypothetical protein
MLDTFGRIANRLADYTIGTVIVLVHVTLADRRARLRLPASSQHAHGPHGGDAAWPPVSTSTRARA